MPNIFKKLANGAKNFFQKLPALASNIVKKVNSGINQGLGAISNVGNQISNGLEKAAPLVGAIAGGVTGDPMLGLELGSQLSTAGAIGKTASNMSNTLQNANLGQKTVALSNGIGAGLQGTQAGAKLNSGLGNILTNTQSGLNQASNSLAVAHQSIASAMTPAAIPPSNTIQIH
jgi:hypothetical protein